MQTPGVCSLTGAFGFGEQTRPAAHFFWMATSSPQSAPSPPAAGADVLDGPLELDGLDGLAGAAFSVLLPPQATTTKARKSVFMAATLPHFNGSTLRGSQTTLTDSAMSG